MSKIRNYPKYDQKGDLKIPIYVLYPVVNDNGKWFCAKVVDDGYLPFDPALNVEFDDEDKCQKACNVANKIWNFSEERVEQVISQSMGLV